MQNWFYLTPLENITTSMNAVPSPTTCEIQNRVYSKQREANTKGENTGAGWECCCRGWAGHAVLGAQGGALGTPGSIQTGLKVLFSLLLAKALLKPLDIFYLVQTWGRWLKCFQVFLAPENVQEGFWWFVLCTQGLSAVPGLSCSTAPLGQLGQPGYPTGTAGSLPSPEALLPLGTPSAATASASGSAGLHWRKDLVLKSQLWACLGLCQDETIRWNNMDGHHMAWIHWEGTGW